MSRGFCQYLNVYYDHDVQHKISLEDLHKEFNSWKTNLGGKRVSKNKIITWIKKYCSDLQLDDNNIYGLRLKVQDNTPKKRSHSNSIESFSPTTKSEQLIYPFWDPTANFETVSPLAFIDYTTVPVQENGHHIPQREWYDSEYNRLNQLKLDYEETSLEYKLIQNLLVQLSTHEPRPPRAERIVLPTMSSLFNNNSVFEELLNRIIPLSTIEEQDMDEEVENPIGVILEDIGEDPEEDAFDLENPEEDTVLT